MAECVVMPLVAAAPRAATAEPAVADAEGEGEGQFTLEEAAPEEESEAPAGDAAAPEGPVPDPLQALIEDLSGITGALREAPAPAGESVPADAPDLSRGARIALAPAPDAVPGAAPEMAPEVAPEVASKVAAKAVLRLPASDLEAVDTDAVDPALADPAAADSAGAGTVEIDGALPDIRTPRAPASDTPLDAAGAGIDSPPADPLAPAPARRHDAALPVADHHPAGRATAVPVARQIAEAVVTTRDAVIEIALAPEELGRLRMVMSGPEHSPHVTIWVERPEILDQLRRNAAFLQECFGDAGMADASFEFQGDAHPGSRDDRPASPAPDRAGFDTLAPVQVVPMAWTPITVPARLDIRI